MKKDFFISYTGVDKLWAEWIAWTLEEAGYTVVFQQWDFKPGTNFIIDMQNSLRVCVRLIAVVSSSYLEAGFPTAEWAAVLRQDAVGEAARLVPVIIDSSRPEGLLSSLVYVDLTDLPESAAKNTLLNAVKAGRHKPSVRPNFPGAIGLHKEQSEEPTYPGGSQARIANDNPSVGGSGDARIASAVRAVEIICPTDILGAEEHLIEFVFTVSAGNSSVIVETSQEGFIISSEDSNETDRFLFHFYAPGTYRRALSIRAREARATNHRVVVVCKTEHGVLLTRNQYQVRVSETLAALKMLGAVRSWWQHPRRMTLLASVALVGAMAYPASRSWLDLILDVKKVLSIGREELKPGHKFSLAEVERQIFGDDDNQETRKGKLGFEGIAFALAFNRLPITGDAASTAAVKLQSHTGIYYQGKSGVIKIQSFDYPSGAQQLRAVAVGHDPKKDYVPNSWVFVGMPSGYRQIQRRRATDGSLFYDLSQEAGQSSKIYVTAVYDRANAFYNNREQIWIEVNDLAGTIAKTVVIFGGKVRNIEFRSVLQFPPAYPIMFHSLPSNKFRPFRATKERVIAECAGLFTVFDSERKVLPVAPDQIPWARALELWSELRNSENEEYSAVEMDSLTAETLVVAHGESLIERLPSLSRNITSKESSND